MINDPEATRRQAKFLLAVEAIDVGGGLEPLDGRVLVYADPPESLLTWRDPFFRFGDDLLVEGTLERPKLFGGFDYPAYLENQGIFGILRFREVALVKEGSPGNWRSKLFDLRRKLSSNIEKALPEPQSAVGRAMLLGYRGQIPSDLAEDFRKTGASHLLAISGLHVGVMLVLSMGVAGFVMGRRRHLAEDQRKRRQIVGARQAIVHEGAREQLTVTAVDGVLTQRLADTLDGATMHLTFNQHRVDERAEVVDNRVGKRIFTEHIFGRSVGNDSVRA